MHMDMKARISLDVGVVGAGLGGLAAACTLAARGHRVTLHERNGWVGGKAATLDVEGYHFDMGPTILIMPSVLRRVFAEADRDLDDYLDLVPLEPQWRCFGSARASRVARRPCAGVARLADANGRLAASGRAAGTPRSPVSRARLRPHPGRLDHGQRSRSHGRFAGVRLTCRD